MYFKAVYISRDVAFNVKQDDLDLFVDSCKRVDSVNFSYYKDNKMLVGYTNNNNVLFVELKEVKNNG